LHLRILLPSLVIHGYGTGVKMEAKPSLLVAVRPKGVLRLGKALEQEFSLVFCHTLADA
jgi:hypothetical protein